LKRHKFFFSFFWKKHKPHSEVFLLHHAISPFSELHNYNLLYLLWDSNFRVKMHSIFFFAKCCWSILESMRSTNKEKPIPRKLQFHVKCICMPCHFSIYIGYLFNIWLGMTVLNMNWFPDRDPTGFYTSESDPDRTGFRKNSPGSDMDIQTAFITAVKYLTRGFSLEINQIGSKVARRP